MENNLNGQSHKIHPERYYNVAQLRVELWNTLKSKAAKLNEKKAESSNGELRTTIKGILDNLKSIEKYWAFPGLTSLKSLEQYLKRQEFTALYINTTEIIRLLTSDAYRKHYTQYNAVFEPQKEKKNEKELHGRRHYFEVLFVDNSMNAVEEEEIKEKLYEIRDPKDRFIYRVVVARTFQDAHIALQFNQNVQACVIRYGIQNKPKRDNLWLNSFLINKTRWNFKDKSENDLAELLAETIKEIRPELDLYRVTDAASYNISDSALQNFRRIFYSKEDFQELHLSILRGIRERYETPFFTALKEYSRRPTGVFHAMPISRGNSVFKSNWIDDFGDFYGRNLFLAETSSTSGGLDSLLQPTGPLKKSQELASKTFGSQHTYFATNGTSTSNKIVLQAIVEPEDVVLIDRDCHKSHHYGVVLSGAYAVYLDSYPLEKYSMYGAVSLAAIKHKLLELKEAGRLDRVKMLLLTNCTFDGLVYNVEKVMEEILSIKPDMIFLWDEAWFGFAAFTYTYRQRTAMYVANKLYKKYNSAEYREKYEQHKREVKKLDKEKNLTMPNPDEVKIRVYSTQSTHKTLTSLRQGSMIHIFDEEYESKVEEQFQEAYMTHTSTSANYQILGSLDVGRRQAVFEGYEMVEKSIELAMILRAKINDHPLLNKYFRVLTIQDLIPENYRSSGSKEYYNTERGWNRLEASWSSDEFVLDPTKINLHIGRTGVDGDTFKNKYLMDQFNIQVNKTSRNTVLFMTNIGTTRSSVSYLLSVLFKISQQLDEKLKSLNSAELKLREQQVYSLTEHTPSLPDFSYFHDSFKAVPGVPGGNLRIAYFHAYKDYRCEYIQLKECEKHMKKGREIVSATFVIPYPPGFPILVPGQVMTKEILEFFMALDVKEIHGYRPNLGLRVFTEEALSRQTASAMMAASLNNESDNTKAIAIPIQNSENEDAMQEK